MSLTRTRLLKLLRILAAVIIIGIITSYAIWRSFNYARGPHIDIFEPKNGSSTLANSITIKGQANRVNNLTINGSSIQIDELGNFTDVIVIFPGVNRITLVGYDQFGRDTQSYLEIVGKSELPQPRTTSTPPPAATSTTASTSPINLGR